MNLIKNTKKGLLAIMLFSFMISCEDHLEEELSTTINQNYLYNTPDGLKSAVIALYNFNRNFYSDGNEGVTPMIMTSRSELTVPRGGAISGFGKYTWAVTPDDNGRYSMGFIWKLYYNIANKATAIIVAAEEIEGMDEAERKQVIAQAKFFRANSYFMIYRIFNNIYVTETPITPQNAFDIIEAKSSEEEILSLLRSDLNYAIENLDWTTEEFGRVTKGVAKHVRAKVAMWEEDWVEAKSQSESLINNGTHSLVGSTSQVFDGNMNNSEQLLVIQFENGLNGGAGGSPHRINWSIVAWYKAIPGMVADEAYGGRGIGFLLPNEYLMDHFTETSLGGDPNDDRDDNNYFRKFFYYNDEPNIPSGSSLGDLVDVYHPNTAPNNSPTNAAYYRNQHPYCLKYKLEGEDPTISFLYSNVMAYRLAETYLIAAEANMRINGSGLSYLNQIRSRAGAGDLTVINQDVILQERARELSFEGQRWFTLKRMGISTMRTQIQNFAGDEFYKGDARTNFQDHYINFPIPQAQLDFLGASYPQNSGY